MSTTAVYTHVKVKQRPEKTSHWGFIHPLGASPTWVSDCTDKIVRMRELPVGWDSYGSIPVTRDALVAALRFLTLAPYDVLPEPNVSPVAGGAIGFHWLVGDHDLEIEFTPDGHVEFLKTVVSSGEMEEGRLVSFGDKGLWNWLLQRA